MGVIALLWLFVLMTSLFGCDSDSTLSPEPPLPRTVHFRKLMEREAPPFPSGVAVTPDGRWLVSLGFRTSDVSLYDAQTLELVAGPLHSIPSRGLGDFDPIFLFQPHAAVVPPDGSMAVVSSRNGVLGSSLPSLELVWLPPTIIQPRYLIRDRTGRNYYFNGEENDVQCLSIDDSRAVFEAAATEGIALSRDERELFVLTDFGTRLKVLGIPDLDLHRSIDLPFSGVVVVPLKGADQAIVLGGATPAGQTAAHTPLMALPVNPVTGSVGSLQILCCESPGGVPFLFADGNQRVEVGEATAVVPTSAGTVTIDTKLGTVTLHPADDLESEQPPCCDIATYPDGQRIIIADALDLMGPGRLVVFEVEEEVVSPNE